ncbi:MAG TPA: hypothetical protein VFX30_04180 [bacterium]|nr:hypothetical protein [bacterium]
MSRTIFSLHLAATLFLVGLIWFVQLVHYPLFDHVTAALSPSYEIAHVWKTIALVAPVMFAEGATGVLLLWKRPEGVGAPAVWIGLVLLIVIWSSSFFFQVPLHRLLSQGFDETAHRSLVATNWIRTIAWSLRGLLVLRMNRKMDGARASAD